VGAERGVQREAMVGRRVIVGNDGSLLQSDRLVGQIGCAAELLCDSARTTQPCTARGIWKSYLEAGNHDDVSGIPTIVREAILGGRE